MKRQLATDSDEEFSLDVPNPDEEFSIDLGIPPPPAAGPAPVNTRGDVVNHQARPVSVADELLPPTNPNRTTLQVDYGANRGSASYEIGSNFTSDTVLTAIFIWNALLSQGGFPLELLALIFNYTIQVFHFLENAVYVTCTDSPISVTSLSDNKLHFFQTNPLTLWDGRVKTKDWKSKKGERYMTSNASKMVSFPVFMTIVYDNIVVLDKNFRRNNEAWTRWHHATQRILKTPRMFGGVIPAGENFTHYYVSAGELILTNEIPGVRHYIAIFDAPQSIFFLMRTDKSFEQYQFNPYGTKRRLFLTVISESEKAKEQRILPAFNGINSVPRMEHLRELVPKSWGVGGIHQDKEPKFFTFYNPM